MSLLRQAVAPKSDQLNADDLVGTSKTITVTGVRVVMGDQPVTINYEGDGGKPYKPAKTMTRVLMFAWGDDETQWVGKSMTLYCDPEVTFGRDKVGGIRISHLSHIRGDMEVSITKTRGRRVPYKVRKLAGNGGASPVQQWAQTLRDASLTGDMQKLVEAWGKVPKNLQAQLEAEKDSCKAAVEKMAAQQHQAEQDFKPAHQAEPVEGEQGEAGSSQQAPDKTQLEEQKQPQAGIEDF